MKLRPQPRIEVTQRLVVELQMDPRNARTHSKKQIAQLLSSIATFGFVNPILVDANGKVIAGHGRLEAARQLGMTTVPTIVISHLTPV